MSSVLLVGLGAMGFGMGQSLLRAGHDVCGHDIDPDAMARFSSEGGRIAELDDAANEADIAVLVVVNAVQTEAILFGDNGIAQNLTQGAVVVSCATFAPDHAIDFEARLAERGIYYLDAPISGGSARAAQGKLSIMAAGSADAFASARPALDAMAETVFELGDKAGSGSAMKIVNQLLAGIHVVSTAEAMAFGIGQGIDPHRMIEVISRSAGSSWMFQNRAPYIADGDYRPHSAVDIFVKDLGIVRDMAEAAGLSVTLADAALSRFAEAKEAGFGRIGDVAVAKLYAREGGIVLPDETTKD
ncbi:L-threonate dehydrogenase [Rhizobium sp. EC-SD404]|uniref:L-threonate dehydrogenase n=1 Tax=Rhizobium sp. EC-SD404 TaxID=2038389 RepID=UPI00125C40B8|nr:L-threonate dehydrogenase [Rhizobium sp. EC-SD404]VVT24458.1 putative dehydrogenase, with NAD(P)-binding Rossmann-fold domain [Rhizobium sp. EC-SD404]